MFGSKFLGFVLVMEANDYLTFPNSVVLSIFFYSDYSWFCTFRKEIF